MDPPGLVPLPLLAELLSGSGNWWIWQLVREVPSKFVGH